MFTWALISVDPASSPSGSTVRQILDNTNSLGAFNVTFAPNDVSVATYTFSLTVSNWIGANSTKTAVVAKRSQAVPKITIFGPALIQLLRNSTLTLQGEATSSCNVSFNNLVYSWAISPEVFPAVPDTSSATLSVPPNTLRAGTTYNVTLTASDGGVSNSANVVVVVGVRGLVVQITGGDKQYEFSDDITLDGSGSYDPEGIICISIIDGYLMISL